MTLDHQLGDLRRLHRKGPLDPFTGNDAADRERLASSAASPGNDRPAENLNPLLFTFQDSRMHVDGIADFEFQGLLTEAGLFGQLQ